MPIRILKKDQRDLKKEKFMKDSTKERKQPEAPKKDDKYFSKPGMLTGGQAKIAAKAPPPNKIDAKDFAVLRAEKAKGRGMGLQDEKVQPGKVMKAKRGSGLDLPVINKVKPTVHKSKKAQKTAGMKELFNKQKSRLGQNPNKAMSTGIPKDSSKFLERRKALGTAKSALKVLGKAGRVGAIGAAILTAGAAAKLGQTLGRKFSGTKKNKDGTPTKKMGGGMMNKPMGYRSGGHYDDKNKNVVKHIRVKKKMGGGMMMNKPMGYKSGTSVKVKCKLGRNKPTKMY